MKKINLTKAWDHITPLKTTRYEAGEHEVTNDIAEAAAKAGRTKESKDGGSAGDAGARGGPVPPQE